LALLNKTSLTVLAQPLMQILSEWGGMIHLGHAAVSANGTTMVNVFVGWLRGLLTIHP
jgi:hypothetical protein